MSQTHTWWVNIASNCVLTIVTVGQGTVAVSPANCATPSGCPCGTTYSITATPSTGWSFLGWGSTPPYVTTNPITGLSLVASKTIQANFQQLLPIGSIDISTAYYSGPFNAGASAQKICNLVLRNSGTAGGTINWEICKASFPSELPIAYGSSILPPNTSYEVGPVTMDIPNNPNTSILLGLRVWAYGETKPTTWSAVWGAEDVFIAPYLLGGIAAIALLYYLLKK